tara:strand:- start:1103 stop:1933 length:831 start_codon:yes stop_codon:yes gene_type:complete
MMNGKPVPGIKGQCPMGSTWSENNMVNLVRSQEDRITQDYSEEDKAAYKEEKAEGSMFSNIMGLINKNNRNQTKSMPELMSGMNPNFMSPNSQRRETFDAGMSTKAEPKKTSAMSGLMENMRNPEWWGQSMSGLPGDTRLMRLGQLMNYYGQTPQQRLKNKQPAELWAANEAAAQKNKAAVLAAGAKRADEIYGKKSIEDLATDVLADVKEMFGDRMFTISSNPDASDKDAMASLASQVATNIKAITLAYPDKTPGEVRKLALEQLMRDRDLDDLR